MRFSLRNQSKISDKLGESFLHWLLKSLDYYFKNTEDIIEYDYDKKYSYKIIHVNNIQHNSDSVFELYIISKKYDVFNLAYKSSMP